MLHAAPHLLNLSHVTDRHLPPQRFTPSAQLARLRAATSNQDHLSEQLVASFIEGGMSEEDFARQFKEVRRVYHRRQVCLDKWEKGSVVWRT